MDVKVIERLGGNIVRRPTPGSNAQTRCIILRRNQNQRAFERSYRRSTHCNLFKPQTQLIEHRMQFLIHRKSISKVMNLHTIKLRENIDAPETLYDGPYISCVFFLKYIERLKRLCKQKRGSPSSRLDPLG